MFLNVIKQWYIIVSLNYLNFVRNNSKYLFDLKLDNNLLSNNSFVWKKNKNKKIFKQVLQLYSITNKIL